MKDSERNVVREFQNILISFLKEKGKLIVRDFGTFKVVTRKAHVGRNPKTGETIDIAEKKAIVFRSSKEMNKLFN